MGILCLSVCISGFGFCKAFLVMTYCMLMASSRAVLLSGKRAEWYRVSHMGMSLFLELGFFPSKVQKRLFYGLDWVRSVKSLLVGNTNGVQVIDLSVLIAYN